MLKGIPSILSPELLKILMEMGHGDTIAIGDGNFPHASIAKNSILVRLDGHGAVEVLDAILTLFPLDTYVDAPVSLMEVVPGDTVVPVIWEAYKALLNYYEPETEVHKIERFAYYERAKKAYAARSKMQHPEQFWK